jgi:hypothetical protein
MVGRCRASPPGSARRSARVDHQSRSSVLDASSRLIWPSGIPKRATCHCELRCFSELALQVRVLEPPNFVLAPSFDLALGVVKGKEPVSVQTLVAKASVEGFGIANGAQGFSVLKSSRRGGQPQALPGKNSGRDPPRDPLVRH